MIRWGFIGCGAVTEKKSGPAFAKADGSAIEAVMSRDKAKARSYAERHNIKKWYTDPMDIIDIYRHPAFITRHLRRHGHESRQARLHREAHGAQL